MIFDSAFVKGTQIISPLKPLKQTHAGASMPLTLSDFFSYIKYPVLGQRFELELSKTAAKVGFVTEG